MHKLRGATRALQMREPAAGERGAELHSRCMNLDPMERSGRKVRPRHWCARRRLPHPCACHVSSPMLLVGTCQLRVPACRRGQRQLLALAQNAGAGGLQRLQSWKWSIEVVHVAG